MRSAITSILRRLLPLALACPVAFAEAAAQAPAETPAEAPGAPTRIACVGDSITYGLYVAQRMENSYPARLQQKADAAAPGRYEVKNFGVSSMTLMQGTTKPYVGRQEYRDSVGYAADVLIIMLGTNDTNGQHRHLMAEHFEADYRKLLDSYRAARAERGLAAPRIILMLPPKCYLAGEGLYDPSDALICSAVAPVVRKLAQEQGLELIDLYGVLGTEWNRELIPDKLHPSAAGAALMTEQIAPVVLRK